MIVKCDKCGNDMWSDTFMISTTCVECSYSLTADIIWTVIISTLLLLLIANIVMTVEEACK